MSPILFEKWSFKSLFIKKYIPNTLDNLTVKRDFWYNNN